MDKLARRLLFWMAVAAAAVVALGMLWELGTNNHDSTQSGQSLVPMRATMRDR